LTKETIDLPLGCLQGGGELQMGGQDRSPNMNEHTSVRGVGVQGLKFGVQGLRFRVRS